MSKRNPWLRPAGTDGLVPVVVLWNHFASLYGNSWRALFTEEAAKSAWYDEAAALFYDRGIRWAMVKTALEILRREVRAETSPVGLAEFADRCLPVFDFEGGFYEAKREAMKITFGNAVWSHPAVYWAARDFGINKIQTANWSRSKGEWVRLLANRLQVQCLAVPEKREEPVYKRGDGRIASEAVHGLRKLLEARA